MYFENTFDRNNFTPLFLFLFLTDNSNGEMTGKETSSLESGYKLGKHMPYFLTELDGDRIRRSAIQKRDRANLVLLLTLGVVVRLYNIPFPAHVVFDEVHFGSFVNEYITGDFFVDVHPALGKMLYYWVARVFGYQGDFDFGKIGNPYTENVPYVAMRLFGAACGLLTVLVSYLTLRASLCRPFVAFFGAVMVLIENSLVIQSRFIFLDSPLILAIALAVLGTTKLDVVRPFSRSWYQFLVVTGIGLGGAISIKFVGFFTLAWAGIFTLFKLWQYLGDLLVTNVQLIKHTLGRALAIIIIPLTIFLGVFVTSLAALPYSGMGAGYLPASIQSTFNDSDILRNMPVEVAYGSTITMKHRPLQLYLHSHNFTYQSGSHEQQVTGYTYADDPESEWVIETKNQQPIEKLHAYLRYVKDGDIIRLYHKATGKYLHVNDVRPPVLEHEYANEVSCDGSRDLLGDINYEWKVKIVDSESHSKNNLPKIKMRATETIFQLIHQGTKCILMAHDTKLPKWAFSQKEILCINEPTMANTLWNIEFNSHPLLDNDVDNHDRVDFGKVSLWSKIYYIHKAMFRVNKSLTEKHNYASEPVTWPFLLRGVNYFRTDTENKLTDEQGASIYLLGNMAIYYVSFVVILVVLFKQAWYFFIALNPFLITTYPSYKQTFYDCSLKFLLGWIMHYLPFFSMERQLFLHHYLPSLYFGILLLAQYIEYRMSKRPSVGYGLMVAIAAGAVYCYVQFLPVIYGLEWTVHGCLKAQWLPTWDMSCMSYTRLE